VTDLPPEISSEKLIAARGFWAGFFCPLNRVLFLLGSLAWMSLAGGFFDANHVGAGVAAALVSFICAAPVFYYLGAESAARARRRPATCCARSARRRAAMPEPRNDPAAACPHGVRQGDFCNTCWSLCPPWIGQEDTHGCGLAVLAMLTGRSYADAKVDVDAMEQRERGPRDWNVEGCTHYTLDRYLAQRYWMQRRYVSWGEPLVPFAPIHYASVQQPSNNAHFVVLLADGTVLDPMREGRFTLADWPGVNQVVGLLDAGGAASTITGMALKAVAWRLA
jgi:hypothetical protein